MKFIWFLVHSLFTVTFFSGCSSVRHEVFLNQSIANQPAKLTIPGHSRKATLGDDLLSEGEFEKTASIQLLNPIKASIPGALKLPFTFSIESCILKPDWQSNSYTYFAAPTNKSTATHAVLGTVLKGDDSVGVRMHKQTGGLEWYVDNSNYNHTRKHSIIWSREVKFRDGVKFVSRNDQSVMIPGTVSSFRQITYGGFSNGNYIVTYREVNGAREYEKDYTIPKANSGSTFVSIKGSLIEILKHSNIDVSFVVKRSFAR